MDWATIGIITGIILSLITALGVWLGPRLVENSRRRYQARQEHLAIIKENVIGPLINRLELYFLPIIDSQLSNVVEKSEFKPIPDAPIDQFGGMRQIELSILTIKYILDEGEQEDWQRDALDRSLAPRVRLQFDELLYNDLKNNHEPELVDKWEAFVFKVEEYNKKCFSYVERISNTLMEQSKLPVWISYEGKHGIDTAGLAAYIWGRQLGLRSDIVRVIDRGYGFDLGCGEKIMAMGSEKEMNSCFKIVSSLVADREEVSKLKEIVLDMNLEDEALMIKKKLSDYIQSKKLRGKCAYSRS